MRGIIEARDVLLEALQGKATGGCAEENDAPDAESAGEAEVDDCSPKGRGGPKPKLKPKPKRKKPSGRGPEGDGGRKERKDSCWIRR